MNKSLQILIICVAALLAVAAFLFVVKRIRPDQITVSKPAEPVVISKPPRILNDVEIQAIQVQKLQVVYTVQQIPDVVRDSFVNFVDWGVEGTLSKLETRPRLQSVKRPLASLEMANPDERMNEDVIEPGIPNRRLVLCAFSETSALVLYQQGGYVGTERLVIFSFGKSSGAWAATLVDYKTGSLEAILDALRRHRYSLSIPKPPVQNPV